MQLGSAEHKAQFFQEKLKEMRESIFFGDFQLWTIQQSLDKLQTDKKEAEAQLERKEFSSANEGKKVIDEINQTTQGLLMTKAGIESQNEILENRIIELGEYVKGWTTK